MADKEMKYIVFAVGQTQQLHAVLFSKYLITHYGMAALMQRRQGSIIPTSAGFVTITPEGAIEVYGRSDSLNLDPMPDDAKLIEQEFGWVKR